MRSPFAWLKNIGPAIIVAAVVLGPGSILTSSKAGASYGFPALAVLAVSTILMIAMVALAARLGVVYDTSPCTELTHRLGRPVAFFVALVVFVLVALFQSSNNVAVIGGLEPIFGEAVQPFAVRASILALFNCFVIACLYLTRHLYRFVEKLMKMLMFLMVVAFLSNFLVALFGDRGFEPVETEAAKDLLPLLGMIGTTFSVAGAFFQAYLVKERGWGLADLRTGLNDSIAGIAALGGITAVIVMTAALIFHGNPDPVPLATVADVARQLEPLFGPSSKIIFSIGILAGALSSFMVNAMIGGTVMSDGAGQGSRLDDAMPRHLTTLALLVGMSVAIFSMIKEGSTVNLIVIAQACTVIGLPALAAALIYLGTRRELSGQRKTPRLILLLASLGFLVACVLAIRTAMAVYETLYG